MNWDFKLDENGDIDLSSGSLLLISDKKEAIRQRFELKFKTFTKEWFWKQSYGGINKDLLFTKGVEQQMLDAWFLTKIQEDPDVTQILEYSSSADHFTRSYTLSFVVLVDGESIEVTQQINQIPTASEFGYPTSTDYNQTIDNALSHQTDIGDGEYIAVDYLYTLTTTSPYLSVYKLNKDSKELIWQPSGSDIPTSDCISLGVNGTGTRLAVGGTNADFCKVYVGSTNGYTYIQTLTRPTADTVTAAKLVWNDDVDYLGVLNTGPANGVGTARYGLLSYLYMPTTQSLGGPYTYVNAPAAPVGLNTDGRNGWLMRRVYGAGRSSLIHADAWFNTVDVPVFSGIPAQYMEPDTLALSTASDAEYSFIGKLNSSNTGIEIWKWVPGDINRSGLFIVSSAITTLTYISMSYDKRFLAISNGTGIVLIYRIYSDSASLLLSLDLPITNMNLNIVRWSKDSRRLYCKRTNIPSSTYSLFYYDIDELDHFTLGGDLTQDLTSLRDFDVVTVLEKKV